MAAKLQYYRDENVPTAVTHGLRLRGIDVLTTQEAEMLGASDEAQLDLATSLERVLVSQDTDFLAVHQKARAHGGLIYAPQWTSIGDMVRGLLLIHDILTPEDMRGHVQFL